MNKLKTKEKIESWLKEMNIKEYLINQNLTVDIFSNVNLSMKKLKKIPIKFGIINGNFDCSDNELTTLEGFPEKVGNKIELNNNKLPKDLIYLLEQNKGNELPIIQTYNFKEQMNQELTFNSINKKLKI